MVELDAIRAVRSALGMTGNGHRYRSVLRCPAAWRLMAARAGQLTPGLIKRAKAWGGEPC